MASMSRRLTLTGLALVAAGGAFWMMRWQSGKAEAQALYAAPLPAPKGALRVYHLGHSLVGRDMPAMLAQLAGAGHHYDSQLGWAHHLRNIGSRTCRSMALIRKMTMRVSAPRPKRSRQAPMMRWC